MKIWIIIENETIFPYFSKERALEMTDDVSKIQEIDIDDLAELDEIFN